MLQAKLVICVLSAFIGTGAFTVSKAVASGDRASQVDFFETKIRPVLIEHCYECHSAKAGKAKGGLRLDSKQGWLVGGDSGPAIIPGKPDESHVLLAINYSGDMSEMPPKSRLSSEVIHDFTQWIQDGAVDPRQVEGAALEKKAIDVEAGKKYWAFQPRRTFAEEDSIDRLARPKSPPATADKLVRRLFLDVVGLPPTLEEQSEFQAVYSNESPERAVEVFLNDLFGRKEFGEKWARHWLDVARYADSNGSDFNLTYPEAWRYRNYVIKALNDDLPYDQFLLEQIAGDLLPYDTLEQRNQQLVATTFLMVGPKMLTERDKEKMRLDIADEQLDTIGRATMGLTLGCARCHDHKFDPIPTTDYYAMAGIFHGTLTTDGILMNNVNVSGWKETDLLINDDETQRLQAFRSKIKSIEEKIQQKQQRRELVLGSAVGVLVDDSDATRKGTWRKSTHRPKYVGDHYLVADNQKSPFSIEWKATLPNPGKYELRVSFRGGKGLATNVRYTVHHAEGEDQVVVDQTVLPSIDQLWQPIGQFEFDTKAVVSLADTATDKPILADAIRLVHVEDLEKDVPTDTSSLDEELANLEKTLADMKKDSPEIPRAMAAQDNESERIGDLHVRIRGETKNLGERVSRGFLQVVNWNGAAQFSIPTHESGRVQLAEWITAKENPLTARVMVNRIWQHLFGRGIVETSDNFGVRGALPSNPELLDFLAEEFVEGNWSVKSVIRKIITSKTYQQAVADVLDGADEKSQFQKQYRRPAPAETIRDSLLAVSGKLDWESRDSVVSELGMHAIESNGKRHVSLGQTGKLRQRSVYLPVVRGAVPPSLAVFDFPNPDLVTGKRAITTVPAQALFMMNSPFVHEMSYALSLLLLQNNVTIEKSIQQLYRRVLIRQAGRDEVSKGKKYVAELMEEGQALEQSFASFVQVVFCSAEFRFIE